jgi:hypothetical protein
MARQPQNRKKNQQIRHTGLSIARSPIPFSGKNLNLQGIPANPNAAEAPAKS